LERNQYIEFLFRKYFDQMVLLAIGYLGDPDDASDLVMNIFDRLLANQTKLDELLNSSEAEMRNYLMLVTKHRCLDQIKVAQNRVKIHGFFNMIWLKTDRNKSIDAFEEEAIVRMKSILAPRESAIFELHLKGYSNEEISNELSISYNTVRNTLTNVRSKIRKVWDIFMK
jgi:RNA polymerase sigma factor (sigma-70 family)